MSAPLQADLRHRFERLFVLLGLLMAGLCLHASQLTGEVLVFRDSHMFYAPAKHWLAETLRAGELPRWWPWDATGGPFLAQPMFSVFHPTTLFYAVLPFWTAFAWQDVAATLLALWGAYALGRTMSLPRAASVFVAVSFAFGGYVVCLTEHTYMKLSVATMPLYLASIGLAAARGGGWRVSPSLVMGLLLLGGDPQVALLTAFAGVAWSAVVPGARVASVVVGVLSPLVGALLAAPQLWPSVRVVPETSRVDVMAEANRWPFRWQEWVGLVAPIDLGPAVFSASTFLGPGVLSLAAASWVVRRRRTVTALWGLSFLSLWLAAGDGLGLNRLARAVVPFWGQFRYPVKSSVLAFLALSMLAGIGFAAISHPRHATTARRVAVGAMVLLGLVAFWRADAWLPGFTVVVGAAALVLGASAGGASRWAGVTVFAASILSVTFPFLRTAPVSFYDPPPFARALQERTGLTGAAWDRIDPAMAASVSSGLSSGCDDSCVNAMFGVPAVSAYMPGAPLRVRKLFEAAVTPADNARLLGLLGARWLLVTDEIQARARFPELMRDDARGLVLVEQKRSLARVHAVRRAVSAGSPEEARGRVFSAEFKPGREVVVEGAWDDAWAAREDQLSVPQSIIGRTNATVTIDAQLPWDGFVVLNEAWSPGWSVTVDAIDAPLLVANGAVRAVAVAAGTHRIEFRYETPGLRAGLFVSILMIVLLLLSARLLHRGSFPSPQSKILERGARRAG